MSVLGPVDISLWTCREDIRDERVTYLRRSCRRDKGTSTRFPSRWRSPHTRAGSQTCPSSCPYRGSPPSSALRGWRRDPAPQTGPPVSPLWASSGPPCSAQSFPWLVVARTDQPGRLGSRDKSAALLPGSGLDRFEICGFRVSRSPGGRKTSHPMRIFNGRGRLLSLEFHEAAPKPFCFGCNHTLMNKSDDFLFD